MKKVTEGKYSNRTVDSGTSPPPHFGLFLRGRDIFLFKKVAGIGEWDPLRPLGCSVAPSATDITGFEAGL